MISRPWRNFDVVLLAATLGLLVIGVAMIASTVLRSGDPLTLPMRQAAYAAIGLGLMFLVAAIDYRFWEVVIWPAYAIVLALLSLVYFIGHASFGSQRWINLGFFHLEPSELAKYLLVLVLAWYLSRHQENIGRFRHIFVSMLLAAPIVVMVYLQPGLGTSLILLVVWLVMLFVAGISLVQLGLLGGAGLAATPLLWNAMHDYMRRRIITFLSPQLDPLGSGYNVNQARIAIGSGGWIGQGLGYGSQSQLHFLRVRHTDFVFSVLGEELGFVGALITLGLFLLLILRILRAASIARDPFGHLIASGVATVLLLQVAINVSMNLGLMPTTGIPLPFLSYGGSSLVSTLIGLGLVQSVAMRHRKIEFQ